jgi:threonine/homoserine/homoserine lactone efflux protein
MIFLLPLVLGFVTASVGISLPGLINMTAAKVSIRDGHEKALIFITGAVIIIIFQTLAAILFARYIDSRPDVVVLLRELGLVIFIAITIYFLFIAKKPKLLKEMKMHSKSNRFFLGMLLSALNFFPIPYYVFVTITLTAYKLFSFELWNIVFFLVGVVMGSSSVFFYYVKFFEKIETKTDFFFKNINKIIGSITGIVALITLINIIIYYI